MELNRRDFLKMGGMAAAGIPFLKALGTDTSFAGSPRASLINKRIGEKVSICAYCAGGCGVLVAADADKMISIEGDPDHPINQGVLCSKAQSLYQIRTVDGKLNPRRVTEVLYRAPNSTAWERKTWDWALAEIARRIKRTRDAGFIEKDKDGITVNRTEAIAHLGGAAHDNEECYLLAKMERALGIVYLEHQARI